MDTKEWVKSEERARIDKEAEDMRAAEAVKEEARNRKEASLIEELKRDKLEWEASWP